MRTFNFYCDESCHLENDKLPYMILGYLKVPYNQKDFYTKTFKEIKSQHHFYGEIKWTKVSKSQYKFYSSVIDKFFALDLEFRAIVIDKSKLDHQSFNQDHNTFYYKMYYHLINHKINTLDKYNVFLDIKDKSSKKKVKKLKEILKTEVGVINQLQNIHSKESLFLQIADLIIGGIAYNLRRKTDNTLNNQAKINLITKIQKQSNLTLDASTYFNESKMNLFFIDLS